MAEPRPERDTELEEKLMEAGNKLLDLPSSVEEILRLLDEVESCLSRVEQSPAESMQNALVPSCKALVDERLFKHTDADVKVAVALCITEITRITAPDVPYSDDQMRDVFQLIVSCFGDLADSTSRSFNKRTLILETVAKVRSCVVMLDLECDTLVIEMFQIFLNSIRDQHQEHVFSSMEKIMSLVLEESEEISVELLSPLLDSVRKDNKEVIPTARKLGEKVLANCATKVEAYLRKAIESFGTSVVDYCDVVASICPEIPKTVEQNAGRAADENKIGAPSKDVPEAVKEIVVDASTEKQVEPANEDTPVTAVSNGVSQTQEDISVDTNSSKKHGDEDGAEQPEEDNTPMKTESQNLDVEAMADTKSKQELTSKKKGKKVASSKKPIESTGSPGVDTEKGEQLDSVSAKAAPPAEKKKEADAESSMPKEMEKESETIISPSLSENVPEETLSKKGGPSKKKESSTKDSTASRHGASKKASEKDSDSEGKPLKHYGKKESGLTLGEDRISSRKETPKNRSKSEVKQIKPSAKKVEPGSANGDKSSSKQLEDKKHGSRGKAEKISSPKTGLKSMKDVQPAKETPKRKHTPDSSKGYGQEVVGEKVKVWWPRDREFYEGKIQSFDPEKGKHTVVYNDGDVEVLNLKRQRFEFIRSEAETDQEDAPVSDDSDMDAASDMPLKKKVRTDHDQSKKQVKRGVTPKRSDRASSSKSKSASSKSGKKVKESNKTDGKLSGGMKSGKTMDNEGGSSSKDFKLKSAASSSKSSGDLKNDDKLATDGKFNEDVKPSESEQDMPPTSRKIKIKIKVKQQIGSAKDRAKEDEDEEKNITDSVEAEETPKLKVASSSKVRDDEVKSNKRRRKA